MSSSEGDIIDVYYDYTAANIFNNVMAVLSLIAIFVFPTVIFLLRKHPLMAVRMPGLVIYELILGNLLVFSTSSQWGYGYDIFWHRISCYLAMISCTTPNILLLIVCLARVLVFYRIVQANVLSKISNPYVDKVIHYLGLACAPAEFQRSEVRIALLQKAREVTSSDFSQSFDSSMVRTSQVTMQGETSSTLMLGRVNRDLKEYVIWVLKMTAWFAFLAGLSTGIEYSVTGMDTFAIYEDVADSCGHGTILFAGIMLIFFSVLLLLIVCSCFHWVNDIYGVKRELIVFQIFFMMTWSVDGILQVAVPDSYSDYIVYIDVSCFFLHGCMTFFYPVVLILSRYYKKRYLQRTYKSVKKVEDFMAIWETETGRAKIFELSEKTFTLENPLFVSETEHLSRMGPKKMQDIYKKYVAHDAPFELNIPQKIIREAKETAKQAPISTTSTFCPIRASILSKSTSDTQSATAVQIPTDDKENINWELVQFEVLKAARKHIIQTMFLNLRELLEVELGELN